MLCSPSHRGVVKWYHDSLQKSYLGFEPRLPCQEETTDENSMVFSFGQNECWKFLAFSLMMSFA